MDRVNAGVEEFNNFYQRYNVPCIIRGVIEAEDWKCRNGTWEWDNLERDLGERMFKCGEDDEGDNIKLKMRHFLRYTKDNLDDSPLYVFDSKVIDAGGEGNAISEGYKPPDYFREDLFEWVGEKR